ncbi:AAA family ATPase [Paenibacillus sp. N3.4]|uniref:AAA family ATPase n=1 Tax=Paenibacillus sp. N3.4 TaxID=2603222 RepID=UPI0011CAF920|nr:AAA family ATPase [Paenibacillus sp. N3.4]TXK80669.1 AAA family ATPase [Paenibacillus sp. N3.4]
MIIMINGAFGSGKTTTASNLHTRVPGSMIFDPEEIGYMLRKLIPDETRKDYERTDDFQDIDLWRILSVNIARELNQKYNKHLIIPMTIYKPINFEYISRGLEEIDNELYHFCLIASEETLRKRLTVRGDTIGGWQFQQIEKCVNAFRDSKFEKHIVTDELDTSEIINRILMNIEGNSTKD